MKGPDSKSGRSVRRRMGSNPIISAQRIGTKVSVLFCLTFLYVHIVHDLSGFYLCGIILAGIDIRRCGKGTMAQIVVTVYKKRQPDITQIVAMVSTFHAENVSMKLHS